MAKWFLWKREEVFSLVVLSIMQISPCSPFPKLLGQRAKVVFCLSAAAFFPPPQIKIKCEQGSKNPITSGHSGCIWDALKCRVWTVVCLSRIKTHCRPETFSLIRIPSSARIYHSRGFCLKFQNALSSLRCIWLNWLLVAHIAVFIPSAHLTPPPPLQLF